MDEDKYIEQYTEFAIRVKAKWKARMNEDIDPTILASILDNVGREIRTAKIEKSRQEGRDKKDIPEWQHPSPQQIELARKLGCVDPESFTKRELSDWIDKHKNW